MDYLTQQNRRVEGDDIHEPDVSITAANQARGHHRRR
jgi:hypothetical protein